MAGLLEVGARFSPLTGSGTSPKCTAAVPASE